MKTRLLLFLLLAFQSSFAASIDPVMPTLNALYACDSGSNSGVYNFYQQTSNVLSAQSLSASNYSVSYYLTQVNANTANSPIVNTSNFLGTNNQVIWVRITNITTSNFAIGSFSLLLSPPSFPTFTTFNPLCVGSTPPPMPVVSTNIVTGTWSPAVIDTSVPGSSVYTFTPDAGQCALGTTMVITILPNQGVIPVFDPIPPVCIGTNISPLPTTSNNGITGTWSPSISNTSTQLYTFTSTNNGSNCPTTTSMTITINNCDGFKLYPFLDSNNNGVLNSGEPIFNFGQFQYEVNNNGIVNYVSNSNGIFYIQENNPANSYDVSLNIHPFWSSTFTVTNPSYNNIQIIAGNGMNTYYFPVTYTNLYNDLSVDIVPYSQPVPGFTYVNKINYTNHGNQTISNGTVTFNHSPAVSMVYVSPSTTTSITNGFTYNFFNLNPFETRSIDVTMQVPTIPTVALGQSLTNTASILPVASDINILNNSTSETQTIIGSYDPNDKTESHGPSIIFSDYNSNDYFNYTIRFENTGTANALTVRVDDVLDSMLDETTIRTISASHPYVFNRVNTNLSWRFDNIQLPPSVANSDIGHGYITFKVKLKPGYTVGDVIPNVASIFFDFNPAIITNTFQSTFVNQLHQDQFDIEEIILHPNPTSQNVQFDNSIKKFDSVVVYTILGQEVKTQKLTFSTNETIEMSPHASGVYLFKFIGEVNNKIIKVIKK